MSPTYRQQPTLNNVRIRTAQDALQVFYGVARNTLTLLSRRLDTDERRQIRPGNVYVWEDRSATTSETAGLNMERWTDGMSWGPSRGRDEFLLYFQKDPQVNERTSLAAPAPTQHIPESDKFIKQTCSVFVSLPEDRAQGITRKWHLTAYFNRRTADILGDIGSIPGIGDVSIPDGYFWSARTSKDKKHDPRPNGQLIASEQSFTASSSAGALYTIFSSSSSEPSPSRTFEAAPPTEYTYVASQPPPHDHSYPVATTSRTQRTYAAFRSQSHLTPPLTPPLNYMPRNQFPPRFHPSEGTRRAYEDAPSLVPLEDLKACGRMYRDPEDEHALRKLSLLRASPSSVVENDPARTRSPSVGDAGDYTSESQQQPSRGAAWL